MPAEVLDGGTIRGTIRYSGDVPPPHTVDVPDAAARCGTAKRVASLEVGSGGGLANAVVSLLDIRRGSPWDPSRPSPTLDQRGCEFLPHVLTLPAGGAVHVRNSDPVTHNVRTAAFENRSVNRMQPPDAGEIELAFAVPERVKVGCDLHSWMSAWIVVSDHPYVAVTDERGRFSLPGAPPGTYTLEIWHEALGARTRPVRVVAGEATEVSVDLSGRG